MNSSPVNNGLIFNSSIRSSHMYDNTGSASISYDIKLGILE